MISADCAAAILVQSVKATCEVENYNVCLPGATELELHIVADVSDGHYVATPTSLGCVDPVSQRPRKRQSAVLARRNHLIDVVG